MRFPHPLPAVQHLLQRDSMPPFMHKFQTLRTLTVLAAVIPLLAVSAAHADDGHDHGDAPPTATGPALPRFAATSEAFELVGVVNGRQLTLYLDHADSNRPVEKARLELEIGDQKINVQPHAEGEFEATLAQPLQPGTFPVTATVTTGASTDLLAGELDLHGDEHAEEATASPWPRRAGWIGGALAVLVALAWGLRRRGAARRHRTGAAA